MSLSASNAQPPRRAVVIGAGVAGLTVAVGLAERGVAVEVRERATTPFSLGCSRMAGGMISPWCELELGCEPVSADSLIARMGVEALDYWRAMAPGMVHRGSLVLASPADRRALDRFAERTQGYQHLDAARLRALEPDLEDRFSAGLYFEQEGHLDPRGALAALRRRLEELGGVFRLGVDGAPDAVGPDEADVVMDCRGLDGRDRLPDLRGVRGEMLVARNADIALSRPVRLLHPRVPIYVVPRGDGVFMVGTTMIESDSRAGPAARALAELITAACALHPGFADAEVLEIGAEVRPTFSDNLPRLHRRGRVVAVNGFFRHGFLAAPAMARMAVAAALDGAFFPEVMSAAMNLDGGGHDRRHA